MTDVLKHKIIIPKVEQPTQNIETSSDKNKRIAKNTLFLYGRMLFGLIVALFTSRVVLNTLGVSDYGVYNVTGGVITMISFLNGSMAGATSRFITYELGIAEKEGFYGNLRLIFSSAMAVHVIIAIAVFIIAETLGLWFLNNKLIIPENSIYAANWVFQMSILSAIIDITQTPYTAAIIAQEKMNVFAYFDVLTTILKLAIVFLLLVLPGDKLIVYAVMVTLVTLLTMFLKRIYAIKHFDYCRLALSNVRINIVKPMLSFSGLDMLGGLSVMGRAQGVSMLANMFFGTLANAAMGISNSIQGAVNGFATNVTMAIKPQIIKSYSSGDYYYMQELMIRVSKLSFYIILFLSLPILIDTEFVLDIWLGQVPKYSVWICRFTLMFIFFSNMSSVLVTGVHATGDIRGPSLINGTLYLSVVPITYIVYKLGGSVYVPFALNVLFVMFGSLLNFIYVRKYVSILSLHRFIWGVFLRVIFVAVLSACPVYFISQMLTHNWISFIIVCITSCITTPTIVYLIGLDHKEKELVMRIVDKFQKKIILLCGKSL